MNFNTKCEGGSVVRVALVFLVFFSSSVFSADKQISCPFIRSNGAGLGLLEGGAWRIDSIIFDTDDFSKDQPRATYRSRNHERSSEGRDDFTFDQTFTVTYAISPTHLTFFAEDRYYSIDRSSLKMTASWYEHGSVQCTISDVETPKNRVF